MATQGKSSNSGCMVASVFLLIAIVVGGAIYYFVVVSPEWALAAQREELRKAVLIAGTPLVNHPQKQPMDYDAEAARLLELHNNRSVKFDNPELARTWAQIETDGDEGLLILQKIGFIDKTKPSYYEIVAKALNNDDRAKNDGPAAAFTRLIGELDKFGKQEEFRKIEAKLNASIGGLQEVANSLSRSEIANAVSVRYLPSWDGTFWGDTVEVQNTSGDALENVEVFVTAHMKDGTSKVHVHYADQWQSGSWLRAVYPYQATDYAEAQAGAIPDSVDVAVYLSSGTAKATYALTSDEWDKVVQSYCSSVTFSGSYLAAYQEEGTGKNYPAGFAFQFRGIPTLPVKSVEVRFTSDAGNAQGDVVWTYKPGAKLPSGESYALRDGRLDGEMPSHIDYIVRFSGTNYEDIVHAY